MIKLYRNIRQNLLAKGKTSKYIKYAIGEIVLVVIGILIALQINNLNEQRKLNIQEIKILKQLKQDLESNYIEITDTKIDVVNRINATNTILNYFKYEKKIDDSLKTAFEMIDMDGIFNSANTTYKYIENQGINVLKNDSLRERITEIYEKDFKNISFRTEYTWNLLSNDLRPLYNIHLKTGNAKSEFAGFINADLASNTPINLEELRHNEEFKNMIVRLQNFLRLRQMRLTETIEKLSQLTKDVQAEIQNLSS